MEEVENRDSVQQPVKCVNDCGFFGNPQTGNMCSKCYNSNKKRKETDSSAVSDRTSKQIKKNETIESICEGLPQTKVSLDTKDAALLVPKLVLDAQPSGLEVTPSPVSAGAPNPDPSAPTPIKTDEGRCYECKKKIGLTAIKCRCGFKFCSKHRYSDQHSCPFDYKAMAKTELEEKNPRVVAAKVNTI